MKILVLESLDWCTIIGSVNVWPESFTVCIQTGLVGIDSLSTVFLPVAQFLAEDASCFVSIRVVAWTGVAVRARSPLLLVVGPIVVLGSIVLAVLLASTLLVRRGEPLLSVLCDGLHIVILFILLHGLNF